MNSPRSRPRIRGRAPDREERYPLCEFSREIVAAIGKQIIYRLCVGRADISGDDFGDIFATAIGGVHHKSPDGLADVSWQKCGWSVKTVQSSNPFSVDRVRLISGRNAPIYSQGIANPLENPSSTGQAVLAIWNERLQKARATYNDLRVTVLVRDMKNLRFALFEEQMLAFPPADYNWEINPRHNLISKNRADAHCFTWQPHGSQFTVIRDIPGSVCRFELRRPEVFDPDSILEVAGYNDDWISIVSDCAQNSG